MLLRVPLRAWVACLRVCACACWSERCMAPHVHPCLFTCACISHPSSWLAPQSWLCRAQSPEPNWLTCCGLPNPLRPPWVGRSERWGRSPGRRAWCSGGRGARGGDGPMRSIMEHPFPFLVPAAALPPCGPCGLRGLAVLRPCGHAALRLCGCGLAALRPCGLAALKSAAVDARRANQA